MPDLHATRRGLDALAAAIPALLPAPHRSSSRMGEAPAVEAAGRWTQAAVVEEAAPCWMQYAALVAGGLAEALAGHHDLPLHHHPLPEAACALPLLAPYVLALHGLGL